MNWFSRQISRTRMGSIRSSSTAYSSGGLFSRHHRNSNSVYVSQENGQLPAVVPQQKISMYDRLVGRKSGKGKETKISNQLPTAGLLLLILNFVKKTKKAGKLWLCPKFFTQFGLDLMSVLYG